MKKIYFTCSFDDGDVADLRLAQLLKKYNLKGTFYIPKTCDLVYKSLSENQIKELATLSEIGGHTISHQVLTRISPVQARCEIFDCKLWLENVVGQPILSFCPPTGRFNNSHIAVQKEVGFKAMRTVEMLSYSINRIKVLGDFVILPTTTQVYNHSGTAYLKNRVKRLRPVNYLSFKKLFNSNWETMSENYLAFLNRISEQEPGEYYFHLWGHSWEIEKYSLWNSLENFLAKVSQVKSMVFCNNSDLAQIVRVAN